MAALLLDVYRFYFLFIVDVDLVPVRNNVCVNVFRPVNHFNCCNFFGFISIKNDLRSDYNDSISLDDQLRYAQNSCTTLISHHRIGSDLCLIFINISSLRTFLFVFEGALHLAYLRESTKNLREKNAKIDFAIFYDCS